MTAHAAGWRHSIHPQPMTPRAAAAAFVAVALAARVDHDRQTQLVRASVLTVPDKARANVDLRKAR
jgi:hypothetical protein